MESDEAKNKSKGCAKKRHKGEMCVRMAVHRGDFGSWPYATPYYTGHCTTEGIALGRATHQAHTHG